VSFRANRLPNEKFHFPCACLSLLPIMASHPPALEHYISDRDYWLFSRTRRSQKGCLQIVTLCKYSSRELPRFFLFYFSFFFKVHAHVVKGDFLRNLLASHNPHLTSAKSFETAYALQYRLWYRFEHTDKRSLMLLIALHLSHGPLSRCALFSRPESLQS